MILGISPLGSLKPFAELKPGCGIYDHILSGVNDIPLTLRVLTLNITLLLALVLHVISILPEVFLYLERGDIQVAFINLSSILLYDKSCRRVNILHASC